MIKIDDIGMSPNMEIRIFRCPNVECGFNASETHYQYARYDLRCPRCKQHDMSEFKHMGLTYDQIILQEKARWPEDAEPSPNAMPSAASVFQTCPVVTKCVGVVLKVRRVCTNG